jgi:hypothetical protein
VLARSSTRCRSTTTKPRWVNGARVEWAVMFCEWVQGQRHRLEMPGQPAVLFVDLRR